MPAPKPAQIIQLVGILLLGSIAGFAAMFIGLPLPFLLGAIAVAIIATVFARRANLQIYFPPHLRTGFVGVIGALIGSSFSPDIFGVASDLALSIGAVTLFVIAAQTLNIAICKRIGRYDHVTAFYASMPGGLVEAVTLGERAGGNVAILTLTHFLRILIVVVLVPLFFYVQLGAAVGSSAGQSFEHGPWHWYDIAILCVLTLAGNSLGRLLRMPASQLIGPMLISGIAHGTGLVQTSSPLWFLFLAQLVVGTGLGLQFSGTATVPLRRVFLTSIAMMASMFTLSALFAFALSHLTALNFDALLLSFAPGGVTEMGLIALSLSISPLIVSAHHIYRIFLTVIIALLSPRLIKSQMDKSRAS